MRKMQIALLALGSSAGLLLAEPPAAAQPAPPRPPVIVGVRSGSYLGVNVKEIDSERARELKLREEHGVEITSVEDDSPAAKAGLAVGDVVQEYNGQRVEGLEQFIRLVRETPAGRQAKMTVSRGGSTQTLVATIGSRKSAFRGPEGDIRIAIPRFEVPVMPDVPKAFMSWRSSAIGIEAESLEGQLADFFGVKDGVLVRSVMKGSAAEKAGIKAGDVITKVDDTRVSTPREVSSAVRSAKSKKTFPVSVVRERREQTLSVTIDDDRSGWDRWNIPRRIVHQVDMRM
jgi:serine protease Do